MSHIPSKPPGYCRSERLFDSEEGSDITFLVGCEPETWRFPGHRSVLSRANPVFKAMLSGPDTTITITDVDSRAFDLLLRYLYNEEVHLQSVSTALCTFYAAQKYMCTGLMTECVLYLNQNLDVSNVLQVYHEMRLHSGQRTSPVDPWAPSAPPYHQVINNKDPNDNFDSTLSLCSSLVHNCLLFIDWHADKVLAEESIEDLSGDCLKEIVERDTLYVSSETLVYQALERWSNRECKRRMLEMSTENRRSVLGPDLIFTPRYLVMSQKEFFTGPMNCDLLTSEQSNALMSHIMDVPCCQPLSPASEEVVSRMSRPRRKPSCQPLLVGGRQADGGKAKKKQRRKTKEGSPKRSCTGSCVADCVLRALACLFD